MRAVNLERGQRFRWAVTAGAGKRNSGEETAAVSGESADGGCAISPPAASCSRSSRRLLHRGALYEISPMIEQRARR